MTFDELIQGGWSRHEQDAEALAGDLEAHAALADDAAKAAAFAALATHTVGEHLGDWERAERLVAGVVESLPEEAGLASPLGNLAVARFLAGREAAGLATEMRAARLAGEDRLPSWLRTRMLLASALVASDRFADGAAVYRDALALARSETEPRASDRAVGITSNNLASGLLGKSKRTSDETALMLEAAEASREFWIRCGTWVNDERGDYLLALVHNAVDRHEEAGAFARRGLETIAREGEQPVDEAFLHLALAQACEGTGDRPGHEAALARADALAAALEDEGLKAWFAAERAKVRAPGA